MSGKGLSGGITEENTMELSGKRTAVAVGALALAFPMLATALPGTALAVDSKINYNANNGTFTVETAPQWVEISTDKKTAIQTVDDTSTVQDLKPVKPDTEPEKGATLVADPNGGYFVEDKDVSSKTYTYQTVKSYAFKEYNTTEAGTGDGAQAYKVGEKVPAIGSTLYAQYDETATVTMTPEWKAVARDGYTFDGWWTSKDDKGKKVLDTDVAPDVKDNVTGTVYAHWKINPIKIAYNGGGIDISAMEGPAEFIPGDKVKLPDPTSKAKGADKKVFKGWVPGTYAAANSGVLDYDKLATDLKTGAATLLEADKEVDLLPYDDKGTVTLFAYWEDKDEPANTNNENANNENTNNNNANVNNDVVNNNNVNNTPTNYSTVEISKTADPAGWMGGAFLLLGIAGIFLVVAAGKRRMMR